ncbi:MAG TPA: hypothetical protein VN729_01075 [Ktedonobacteraceae bacterium]|nr:hypothetical protein [Ktedonobacteraceae bacterium]
MYGVAFVLSFFWNGTLGLIACALLALGYLLPSVADRVRLTSPDRPDSRLPQGPSAYPKIAARPAVLRAEPERPSTKRQVLLTGAAGGIGSAFFRHAASTYAFRLARPGSA